MNPSPDAAPENDFASVLAAMEEAWESGDHSRCDALLAKYPHFAERLQRHRNCVETLQQMRPSRSGYWIASASGGETSDASSLGSVLRDPLPAEFGRFRIRRQLGHGGFGIVYLAHDPHLQRDVALKLPRLESVLPPELRERFQREARAGARLDHPNIAAVYETGCVAGIHYIASAYVPGCSLNEWLRERDRSIEFREAAQLVLTLCEAVEHGHRRGVLHRDLKPANVLLVGEAGSAQASAHTPNGCILEGQLLVPKITDFGLAKLVYDEGQTRDDAAMGTPSYMAPEQTGDGAGASSAATDVYGLGTILYELLAGRPPFTGDSPLEVFDQVRRQDVLAPSRLRARVPRDLETICLKCLEKDPRRRYASAAELGGDLQRFLSHQPIRARRTGPWGHLIKWAKRRPAIAALLFGLLVVSVAGLLAINWMRLESAEGWELAKESLQQAEINLYLHRIALAHHEWEANRVHVAKRLLAECSPELRNWEWHYLNRLCHLEYRALHGLAGPVYVLASSSDGTWIALPGPEQGVRRWDFESNHLTTLLPPPKDPRLRLTGLAIQGRYLACTWSSDQRATQLRFWIKRGDSEQSEASQGLLVLFDLEKGSEVFRREMDQGVYAVALTKDMRQLAWSSQDGSVEICSTANADQQAKFTLPVISASMAFSPDGRTLALARVDGPVSLANVESQQLLGDLRGHRSIVRQISFSPDGQSIATASLDRTVRLWSHPGRRERWRVNSDAFVWSVEVSPDGKTVVSASADGAVVLWDLKSGREQGRIRGHSLGATAVAFGPRGQWLFAAGPSPDLDSSGRASIHAWDFALSQAVQTSKQRATALSPDARWALSRGRTSSSLRRRGPSRSLSAVQLPESGTEWTRDLRVSGVSPSLGSQFVAAWSETALHLLEMQTGEELTSWQLPPIAQSSTQSGDRVPWTAAVDREAQLVAIFHPQAGLHVHQARSGEQVWSLKSQRDIAALVFSLQRKLLATGSRGGAVAVYDARSGRRIFHRDNAKAQVSKLAFSPNGELVAVARQGRPAAVEVWDVASGKKRQTLKGHLDAVESLAFTADGLRLATGGRDLTIRIWDLVSGQALLTLRGPGGNVTDLAFHPDGNRLVSLHGIATINTWEATAPLEAQQELRPPDTLTRKRH